MAPEPRLLQVRAPARCVGGVEKLGLVRGHGVPADKTTVILPGVREDRGPARRSTVHHLLFIRLFLHEVCPGGAGRRRLRKLPQKLATDAYSMRTIRGKCCMGHMSSPWSQCSSCLFTVRGNSCVCAHRFLG
jgi:hypothetical protein